MRTRFLGRSGLQVSVVGFGSATFGGGDDYYRGIGSTQVDEARRMIDICLDHGVNFFDSSDAYSSGLAEEILGEAIGGRRDRVLIGTKLRYPTGTGPNDAGLSRHHILDACDSSLRRLKTDYIDLLQLHEVDPSTPLDETLRVLDDLVRAGKVRYLGVSNYSAWMIVKALAISEARGWERFISSQVSYSLIERDVEFELMPMAIDQGIGNVVWGPLAGGLLSGKFRRGLPAPAVTRRAVIGDLTPIDEEFVYDVVDVASEIADARGVTVAQVAINWALAQPSISSVLVGARTEEQLRDNLAAASWALGAEELQRLDRASAPRVPYPVWHQRDYASERPTNPWTRVAASQPQLEPAVPE